jgi:hypothetical protein
VDDRDHKVVLLLSADLTEETEEDLPSLLQFESSVLSVTEAPDINNDGYAELWFAYPDHGILVYGSGDRAIDTEYAWKMYYEEPCTKIAFTPWFDQEIHNAICQNDHISIWEIGSPTTSNDISEGHRLTNREDATDMTATNQYIIAHHKNESFLTIYDPWETTPTRVSFSEDQTESVHLFRTATTSSTYSSLYVVDQQRNQISYDEIGLFFSVEKLINFPTLYSLR